MFCTNVGSCNIDSPTFKPSISTTAIDRFHELPRVKGPKLPRFKDGHYERIEYLELLSRSDDGEPNGDHGYVFKVRIDGELYALKIACVETSTTN